MKIRELGIAAWAAFLVTACATPRASHPGRHGLFDRLSDGESVSVRSPRRAPAVVAQEIAPAAPARVKAEPRITEVRASATGWRWPLDAIRFTSGFGNRGHAFHEGVDLAARVGTPVYSVDRAKVAFSGSKIRGYGRMVILKHEKSGLLTVYAHLSKPLVKRGQIVQKGQRIALSGQTGRTSGPHLHFEVRKGVVAFDPAQVLSLPKRRSVLARR